MNKGILKTLRLIIPGLFIYILIIFIPYNFFEGCKTILSINIEPWSAQFIITIILGVIYHLLGIRSLYNRDSLEKINSNIKDRLLEPFVKDPEISNKTDYLKCGRTMMHIFYNIVDNDPSLTSKSKNVYFNGIFLSSCIDLIALSYIGALFYFVIFLFILLPKYLIFSIFLISIFLLTKYIILPVVVNRHIDLSNEQLESIRIHYLPQLREKIKSALLQ